MTKSRDEEITAAAKEKYGDYGSLVESQQRNAFIKGAKWADKFPRRSVEFSDAIAASDELAKREFLLYLTLGILPGFVIGLIFGILLGHRI